VIGVDQAAHALGDAPLAGYTDLGFARLDSNRGLRTGDPEVVYGAGKTPDQVVALLGALRQRSADRPDGRDRQVDPAVRAKI
jgi:NCAIR mutase (PurE)-related protein